MMEFLFTKTPLFYLVQNFWRDEAYSFFLAKKPLLEILPLTARDFNPPLYYLLMHLWIPFVGKNEILLRLLSILPYLVMIYVAFLCFEAYCKKHKLSLIISLVIFATTAPLLYYAFEARMYSLLAFFTLLSSYAFLTKKKKLYSIATVAGLYTHYFMLLVVGTQLIFCYLTKKKKISLEEFLNPLFSLALFLPWLIYVVLTKHTPQSFWITAPTPFDLLTLLGRLYTGYETGYSFFKGITTVSIVLSAVYILGLVFLKKRNLKTDSAFLYFALLVVVPGITVGIVSIVRPLFLLRYLIVSSVALPIFLLLVADRLPLPLRYLLFAGLLFISISYQTKEIQNINKIYPSKTIKEIRKIAGRNDLLYVKDDLDYFPGLFYFGENNVYIYMKNYDEIPDYVGKVLIPKSRDVDRLPYYPQKAFVLEPDYSYKIEALY